MLLSLSGLLIIPLLPMFETVALTNIQIIIQ